MEQLEETGGRASIVTKQKGQMNANILSSAQRAFPRFPFSPGPQDQEIMLHKVARSFYITVPTTNVIKRILHR